MRSPSPWYTLFLFVMAFMIFQWLFTAFNMLYSGDLIYPYDIFGLLLDVTDSFGPRTWGCNLYQNLSAGVYESEDRPANFKTLRIMQLITYVIVVLSLATVSAVATFPQIIGDGYGGKSLIFYIPAGILIIGAFNLLLSSYGQFAYLQQDDAKYSKHVSFDFIGTIAQIAISPNGRETEISNVWNVQASFNFIFGLSALVIMFSGLWYLLKIGGVESSTIQQLTTSQGNFPPVVNWLLLALVMIVYYGSFLSITVGAINNKYNGYPNSDGTCNKTYNKIDSVTTIQPITRYMVTVAQVESSNIFLIDGENKPQLTMKRGQTYVFDQSDSSNANHQLKIITGSNEATYNSGVTTTGVPGEPGAQVSITLSSDGILPSDVKYSCVLHGAGMGNTITIS